MFHASFDRFCHKRNQKLIKINNSIIIKALINTGSEITIVNMNIYVIETDAIQLETIIGSDAFINTVFSNTQ